MQLKVIDKVGMPHVMDFILDKLDAFDLARLEWIKLLPLTKNHALHGCCSHPVFSRSVKNELIKGYRIRASVNVEMAPPIMFEHWGRIPSRQHKQGWYSGEQTFIFADLEECALHTLAHECFHFLSHTRQLNHKNTEANANWWADQWLDDFTCWKDSAG
jgi:hypothetical protein